MRLKLAVDFVRGLGHQEQAAADQDDVAPGDACTEQAEQRLAQRHQPGQGEQQHQAEDQRQRQADLARPLGLLLAAAGHQHRDENKIVDAEDDFERGERNQRRPGMRVEQQIKHACLRRRGASAPRRRNKVR